MYCLVSSRLVDRDRRLVGAGGGVQEVLAESYGGDEQHSEVLCGDSGQLCKRVE